MKRLKSDAGGSGTTPVQSTRGAAPPAQPPAATHPPPMASTAPSRLPERGQPATTPQQPLPTIPELHEEGAAGEHCPWPAARSATAQPAAVPGPARSVQSASATPHWQGQQPGKPQRQRQRQQQVAQPPDLELKSAANSDDEAQGSTAGTDTADCGRGAACRRRLAGNPAGYQLIPSPLHTAIPAAALTLPPGSPLAQSPHQTLPLLQLGSPGGQSPAGWALVPWQPPSPLSPLPPLPNGAASRQHAAGWHLEQASSRQALAGGRKRPAEGKGEEQPAAVHTPDDATAMSTDEPPSTVTIAGLPRQLSDALKAALTAQHAQQAEHAQHAQQPEQPQRPHEAVAAAAAATVAAVAPTALAHAAALPVAAATALPASSISCCCDSMEE